MKLPTIANNPVSSKGKERWVSFGKRIGESMAQHTLWKRFYRNLSDHRPSGHLKSELDTTKRGMWEVSTEDQQKPERQPT